MKWKYNVKKIKIKNAEKNPNKYIMIRILTNKTIFLQGIIYILRFLFTYSKIVTSVARCLKSKAKHVYPDVMFAFHWNITQIELSETCPMRLNTTKWKYQIEEMIKGYLVERE